MKELSDEEIPSYEAYGFNIAEVDVSQLPAGQRQRFEQMRKMREIVAKFDAETAPARS
jgi:hypothetical protein